MNFFKALKNKTVLMRIIICFLALYLIFTSFFLYCFQSIIFPKYEDQILSEGKLSSNMIENQLENTILKLITNFNYRFFADTNSDVNFWVNLQNDTITLKDSISMISYLKDLIAENPYLYSIELHFKKSNQIVSSKYGLKEHSEENSNFFPWINSNLLNKMSISITEHTLDIPYLNKLQIITFSQTLKLHYDEECVVYYSVSKENLARLLNITETDCPLFLVNSYDNVVLLTPPSYLSKDILLNDEDLPTDTQNKQVTFGDYSFLPCSSTGDSSFKVVKYIPTSEIKKTTHDLNSVFRFGLIVILVISVVWGLLVLNYLYVPWKKLLFFLNRGKSNSSNSNENEYNQVIHIFQTLNSQVTQLENTLQEHEIILKNNFLSALLHGELKSKKQIEDKLKICNLSFPHENFLVFDIHFKKSFLDQLDPIDFQFVKAVLQNHIRKCSSPLCQYSTVEFDPCTLSTIICFKDCDIFSQLDALFCSLAETEYLFSNIALLSVGNIQTGIEHIISSKKNSETALQYYYFHPAQTVFFYKELHEMSTITEIPLSIIKRWKACLKSSDLKQSIESFKNIAFELSSFHYDITYSKPYLEQMFWDFYHMIQNSYEDISLKAIQIDTLPEDYIQLINLANSIYQDWISLQNSFKMNRKQDLVAKATAYINQNICLPLSLDEVAAHVSISPTYLSKIFPEITGSKFSDYINIAKMEQASRLLVETPNNIEAISQSLGFTNANYFIRRFKQFYGTTPAQYRSKHMGGEE